MYLVIHIIKDIRTSFDIIEHTIHISEIYSTILTRSKNNIANNNKAENKNLFLQKLEEVKLIFGKGQGELKAEAAAKALNININNFIKDIDCPKTNRKKV